jgi:hypothetical protein
MSGIGHYTDSPYRDDYNFSNGENLRLPHYLHERTRPNYAHTPEVRVFWDIRTFTLSLVSAVLQYYNGHDIFCFS